MAKESAENIQKLKSCWDAGDGVCVAKLGAQIELDEKAYTALRQQDNMAGRAYEDSAKWYADIIESCNGECGWLSANLQKNFADGMTGLVYGALASATGSLPKPGQTVKPVSETIERVPGFNIVESRVINEAQNILKSNELTKILEAHKAGTPIEVTINGRLIQYEPGLPASGMTMFGESGFLIGREAFSSQAELQKTILHELHRLNTSASSSGVSGSLATQETKAAFDFAERASNHLNGGKP